MGSRIPQSIAPPTIDQSAGKGFRPWLGWPLGAIAASAAAITAGALAWGLHWIVVADLAPLLFIAVRRNNGPVRDEL